MLDNVMLGLGFAGGLIYLAAYFSLTRGWVSGTSYLFHGTSVFSCIMIAASSAYSQAWPSAVMNVIFIIVGPQMVKKQAEEMGLDKIFIDANFEWREAGCSMCLGMNPDILSPGERCASTSNRNFEGRQGNGGRTHLVSPVMAAAAAINGHFVDVRKLNLN